MIGDVFGVGTEPFGISPDPRFMYFDPELRQAHEALLSGLREGIGLAVLAGEHGVGKTMLLHCLAAELDVADHLVVSISCLGSPSVADILRAFSVHIGFPLGADGNNDDNDRVGFADILSSVGVCGSKAVLLLDDADGLSAETLRALLALSGGGTENGARVSIVVAGSLDFARRLAGVFHTPLGQAPDLMVSLSPLKTRDVESYVLHRLHMAGYGGNQVFAPEAINRVARHADGNPQAINRICRAAMFIAQGQSEKTVSASIVDQVTRRAIGGRRSATLAGAHERQTPRGSAAAGGPSLHGPPVYLEAADTPSAPAPADEVLAEISDAAEGNGAFDCLNHRPETVMPSGREMSSYIPVGAKDAHRHRLRGPRRGKWLALGAVSVVGAAALYLVASGESIHLPSVATDTAAGPAGGTVTDNALADRSPAAPAGDEAPSEWREAMTREPGTSLLEKAVSRGDIDAGADINARLADGRTPLTIAAENGDEAMVLSLIDRGADPSGGVHGGTVRRSDWLFSELESSAGNALYLQAATDATAMDTTATGNKPREDKSATLARELLLSTAGDGRTQPNRPPSPAGPREQDIASVPMINAGLPASAGAPEQPYGGVTPLIAAVNGGHAGVVDILLAAGADVNASDALGRTPLIAAVTLGDRDCVQSLVARKVDVYAVDRSGRSALDIARENGRQDLVQLISARAVSQAAEATLLDRSPNSQWTNTDVGRLDGKNTMADQPSHGVRQSAPTTMKNRVQTTQVQRYLRRLGYDPGVADGVAGKKTTSAVRAFQTDHGAKADGQISASLLNSLMAASNARGAKGLRPETPEQIKPTQDENVFSSILSGLQNLRGLDFNSTENPAELREYCRKNSETWVYDQGTRKSVFCKQYVKSSKL